MTSYGVIDNIFLKLSVWTMFCLFGQPDLSVWTTFRFLYNNQGANFIHNSSQFFFCPFGNKLRFSLCPVEVFYLV